MQVQIQQSMIVQISSRFGVIGFVAHTKYACSCKRPMTACKLRSVAPCSVCTYLEMLWKSERAASTAFCASSTSLTTGFADSRAVAARASPSATFGSSYIRGVYACNATDGNMHKEQQNHFQLAARIEDVVKQCMGDKGLAHGNVHYICKTCARYVRDMRNTCNKYAMCNKCATHMQI